MDFLKQIIIWLIPSVPAIVVHEYAHGWVAERLGDPTAREAGRLSLNPLRHIDPIGTIIIPCLMIIAHIPFVFGWAKPVPVDFSRLKDERSGTFLVALAGPFSNMLMMFGWLLMFILIALVENDNPDPSTFAILLAQMAISGTIINLAFILLNLIPIPPLDGGRIVVALLPEPLSSSYAKVERYGIIILLLLIITGIFGKVFAPLLDFFLIRLGIPLY